ncbi:RING finger protein 151-like [Amblyomma americanum]
MEEGGREPPLHRVRHLLTGANWRPTRFVDDVPYYHTCGLCNVIPKKTMLLPCSHVLCESCHKGSLQVEQGEDGVSGVCPLDRQPFQVRQCARIRLSANKVNSLQAYCWNQDQGCDFVGTLQDILTHCEEECAFHALACPRCGQNVLHAVLPEHYTAGCGANSAADDAAESPVDGDEAASENGGFSLEDVKALLRELEVLDAESSEVE